MMEQESDDPLLEHKNAYFITDTVKAPDQNFNEILQFRKAYRHPKIRQWKHLRFYQSNIRTTRFPDNFFIEPYAFYRVHKREDEKERKSIKRFICNPYHFETSVYDDYKHLEEVFLDQSSEDLLGSPSTTSFRELLVGDIVAVANIWKNGQNIFAAQYVVIERCVKKSDALIYKRMYEYHHDDDEDKKESFVASAIDIPRDYAAASFDLMGNPEFDLGGRHAIGQCEVFIPVKGVQRFAANFADDILHPDPRIRQSCIATHQNSHEYRSERQKNYQPLVLNYSKYNSFTRRHDKFTNIDEILKYGNQEQVYNLCTIVSASLAHHKMLVKSLDVRNHALQMEKWTIKDEVDYQIEINFRIKKFAACHKKTHIPKKAMMKIYGILPTPLEVLVVYHYEIYDNEIENMTSSEKKEKYHIRLSTVLRILDNIAGAGGIGENGEQKEENEEREDIQSIGKKMYLEVLDSLNKNPEFLYGHLISGEAKDPIFIKKFRKNLPDSYFNELMRNSRNSEGPPQFDYTPDFEKRKFIEYHLENLIKLKPTEEQIDTVYFAIHARNTVMAVEAPIGGGKTTTLAATCCIATEHFQFRQLIVSESNGAVVSVCRKLAQFGAKKVLRITSLLAQKRHGSMLSTDYDIPIVAERIFSEILMNFDNDPDKNRSAEELAIIERCYRNLSYMHVISSQSRFRLENLDKLRKLVGHSVDSAPEDPDREKVALVFKLVNPDIIIGTATQIEQLLEHHKSIDLSVDIINIDKASVESIYSLYTLISILTTKNTKKIILFGDSQQFGPNCNNLAIKEQFRSAMDIVGKGLAKVDHKIMFRCPPDTAKLLSNVFYQNKLEISACCPTTIDLPYNIWRNPKISLDFKFVGGRCQRENDPYYQRTCEDERFMRNHFEALEIRKMCEEMIDSGIQKSDIMILSFYNGQIRLLKELLKGYTILTVRSSQGLDAKIVILSVARTEGWETRYDEDSWRGESNFTKRPITEEYPFLLVAMSRAREKCLVLIDPEYYGHGNWSKITRQMNNNNR